MYVLGYSGFTRSSRINLGVRNSFAKTHQTFDNLFEFRNGEVPFSLFPLGYFGHDASAALIKDGEMIACASEERFTRMKFSLNLLGNTMLPCNAINYCLREAGITMKDVDVVAHYCEFTKDVIDKRLDLLRPFISKENSKEVEVSYINIFNEMMNREVVISQFEQMTGVYPKIFIPVRHHMAHAASCYYPSGFNDTLIYTLDGTGELESSTLSLGNNGKINELRSIPLPTSLGALYLITTMYLGFKSLGDEYKVMGLASYGKPEKYRKVFDEIVALKEDGIYSTEKITSADFKEYLLSNLGPERRENEDFNSRHADIASSLQEAIGKAALHTLKYYRNSSGMEYLCMAGGVALNCTMNGIIAKSKLFKNIFIQPASSDEGCSAGAAYYAYNKVMVQDKLSSNVNISSTNSLSISLPPWKNAYFGPDYNQEEMLSALESSNDKIEYIKVNDIAAEAAKFINDNKVIGWFQGKMEFGPRALGNRSIIASPVSAAMKDIINEKVKRRESFRPFAPSVLEEMAKDYFEFDLDNSPYMLFAFNVYENKRNIIPAVTHVDGSARVQTVSKKNNPLFWNLINEYYKLSGVPIVLNTSFNVKNEPIVCSPQDAINCFLSTNIDLLVMGDYLVKKKNSL